MAAALVPVQYYNTNIFWQSYKNSLAVLKPCLYIQYKSFKGVPKSLPYFAFKHSTISHTHTLNPMPYQQTPYKWPPRSFPCNITLHIYSDNHVKTCYLYTYDASDYNTKALKVSRKVSHTLLSHIRPSSTHTHSTPCPTNKHPTNGRRARSRAILHYKYILTIMKKQSNHPQITFLYTQQKL